MQRNFCLLLAFTFLGLMIAARPACAANYSNARYGYAINYPADQLVPEREADAGDGRAFHAQHGAGRMSVWGSFINEDLDQTPNGIFRDYAADCKKGRTNYKVIKPKLVAFSCITAKGLIVYQKTLIDAQAVRSVRFEYPSSEQAAWDSIVKAVARSLSVWSIAN